MSQSRRLFAALILIAITGVAEADGRMIVPVVGSTAGVNGANFRTELQLHNPGTGVMRGSMVFLPQAATPSAVVLATLGYEVGPKQTLRYADVLATMGASGLGSLDILPLEGGRPRVVVRAFDDQGNFGTRGLMIPALDESEAPVIGYRFVLVAPSNTSRYRFNIGVRTLGEASTTFRVVERDAAGAPVGEPIMLEYAGESFRQQPAELLLGRSPVAGHTYSFEALSGAAFVYATTVDNQSNDGSLQLDRPVNRPPLVSDATFSTEKNQPLTIPISATDPDDDPMTFQITVAPAHGTLSDLPNVKSAPEVDVSVVYTPATDYQGPDMFTVLVADDVNGRTFAQIVINVGQQTGLPPTAVNDKYTINEGETLTVNAPGVLANDTDPENNPLIAQLVQGPFSAAKFTFNTDGSFVYRPRTGFAGAEFFLYKASDGGAASNVARVTIVVNSTNLPPVAAPDAASTTEDAAIGIPVLANDSDPEGGTLTVSSVNTTGTLGAVSIGAGGVINYDPTGSAALQALAAAAIQTDTFTYTVRDNRFDSSTATVTVTVTGVDDLPTAGADAVTMAEDAGATPVNVLANDVDIDGGAAIAITGVTQGANGAVVITGGGTGLTYQPNADFCGSDSFTYTITGGAVGTVSVTVTCVNDAPTANGDAQSTPEDTQIVFAASTLTANDVRGPANEAGQTLTVTAVTSPTTNGGTVSLAGGNITYNPPLNFIGNDTFTYTVTDDGTTSGAPDPLTANGTVTVSVVCPTITVSNPATTTGTAGTPFSQTFTQTGDIGGGLTFATASALPTGLTLSVAGVLAGTPTQTGSFPIVVTAINGNGCSGSGATYTLVISCQVITVSNPANTSGTGGAAFSETFTQSGAIGTAVFTTPSTLPAGLTLSAAGVLSGTPTQTGSFPIVVMVTDDNGCTGTGATYTLVIACPTVTVTAPVVTTGTAGVAFSETFTQTGAIGTATFTTSSALPAGLTLSAAGVLSGTPTVTGSFPIDVTVTDSNGCTGTAATYTLVIACQTITVNNPANTSGTAGAAFSETFTHTDGIGTVTFTTSSALPAGLTFSAAGVLSGTPTVTGSFPIDVTVTDANGCTGTSATYTLVIACQTIAITNPATTTGTVNAPFSATFTETSSIGGATFTTSSTLPAGLTLATSGVLSGTPTQPGTYPIVVTVTDGNGCTGTSATYNLVIGCQTITVTSPANSNGTVASPFSETITQTGAVGTATFTTLSTLPAGLTLAANGVLSGTPTQPGNFPIVVTVTDANGCTGTSATYNLVIACQLIAVTNPANATGPAGSPFSETFTQTGAIGSATFTTASTLPTGLTLSTAGVLSGTPAQGGTFPIVVTVTDANGCTGTGATYNLVITCPVITVNNPANANGTAGSPFSELFTQTGGVGTGTFTLASGTLPTGLTLATDGTLSGTPTQTGSFPITVTATDANGCTGTGATYTIVIACQTVTVNNPANANGTANAAFSESFTHTSGIGTVTFTLASGTLPTGLTLATDGTLSGTPTQTGSFPITVTATDANGCTGTGATYTLVIACQTITVNNPANSAGAIGTAFSETFTQTNAIGTSTFTTASALPTGLTLSSAGVLSGTPTQTGTFPITVTVTDANGCTGTSATYNLVIGCQTITVTNPANASGTVGAAFSETFTQSGAIGTATFTTASPLPAGITLSTAGVLSGTTTSAGTFPIVVTVTDSNGCTGTGATYSLVIACNVITVTNPANPNGIAGTAFSETFTQSGGNGTITWSVTGTLPTGITLNTSSGVLSGTTSQVGSFPVTVTATDGNGCAGTGATYTLVIACQTITVTNPAVSSGTAGTAFSQTFTVGGTLGTTTWSVTGTLPTGFTLNTSTGELSGTTSQTGSFPVTVRATDTNGCFDDSSYTLTIVCQTITVTNPAVTSGSYNVAFSQTFGATGILGTATWSVTGSLPTGLTLNTSTGMLSGTPTQTGSFTVTVRATDTNGCFGESSYTLLIAPTANSDTYTNLINNTQAVVVGGATAAPTTPFASLAFANRLIANDASDAPIVATAQTVATTQGGSVTIEADGTFVYTPPVSAVATPLATDGFTYTITSNGISVGGTVSLTLTQRVWYVSNSAANGGLGRSSDPFDTLAEAESASFANDYIFVHFGAGTTNGQNAGIILKNGQSLIGEFMGLSIPVSVNGQASPAVLLAQPAGNACSGGPCRPLIGRTGANNTVVTATDAIPAQISGLSLDPPTGTSNAIDVTTNVAFAGSGTLVINQNVITDSGAEGIDINAGGTGTLTLDIQNTTFSGAAGTSGIDVTRTNGSVVANISNNANVLATGTGISVSGGNVANTTITGFSNNSVSGNSLAAGVVITNVTFDANTSSGGFQQVGGNNLAIGASGNPVGTTGLTITNSQGNIFFDDMDVFAATGNAVTLSGTGGGLTFGVTPASPDGSGTSSIDADNGAALDVTSAAIDLRLTSLQSNTATSGVSLNTVSGQFRAPSGSSIAKASGGGAGFSVASSSANVTYGGTLSVTSGSGVSLTTNTGAVNFSGTLTLNTGTNAAFTATGVSGTVTATNTASTLQTTTGTALNVNGPDIGSGGLVFLSINVNGAANGILLQDTGGTAGLTVSGTGTTDGSGGTIQNTTGRGASFINASNINLKNMNFTNAGTSDLDADNSGLSTGDNLATNAAIHLQSVTGATTLDNLNITGGAEQGINGNTVANFTLSNSSIADAGNGPDEDGIHFYNMSGTSSITNTTINCTVAVPNTTGGDDHFNLQMQSGTLNLTISGGSATNANKGSGYLFGIRGNSNATITMSSVNTSNNFSGGIVADAFDTATMELHVLSSTSSGNNDQLSVSAGDNSAVELNATGNTLSSPNAGDFVVVSLLGSAFDTGYVFEAILNNNTITTGNDRTADGVFVFNAGGGAMQVAVTNNNIFYRGTQRAVFVQAGQDGSGATNVTITGNAIDVQLDGTLNAVAGILAQTAITGPGNTSSVCADIGGAGALSNTFTHSLGGVLAAGDIRVRQRNDGTVRLPGYVGGATDTAAVIAYLNGRNTEVSTSTATFDSTGFAGGAACTQPIIP